MKNIFAEKTLDLAKLGVDMYVGNAKKISTDDESLTATNDATTNKVEVKSNGFLTSSKVTIEF